MGLVVLCRCLFERRKMEKISDSLIRIAVEMNINKDSWSKDRLLIWSSKLFQIAIELTRIIGQLDGTKIIVEKKRK